MKVIHLPDKYKASEKSNVRSQKNAKPKNENQNAEPNKLLLKLSDNLQTSLMSNIQLSEVEVDWLISAHIR